LHFVSSPRQVNFCCRLEYNGKGKESRRKVTKMNFLSNEWDRKHFVRRDRHNQVGMATRHLVDGKSRFYAGTLVTSSQS
jgi:hypothetical protein